MTNSQANTKTLDEYREAFKQKKLITMPLAKRKKLVSLIRH